MYRNPLDLVRLFMSLFQDMPPLPKTIFLPGLLLIASYPVLAVALGHEAQGEAFATAFLLALALRIGIGFEGMVKRMMTKFNKAQTVRRALLLAVLPLVVLTLANDPLWCQRMQSVFYLVIGGIFLMDVLKGKVDTAMTFWPDEEMRSYLPNLTRVMVIYNFAFLLLNETMIQSLHTSYWMLFWAVLPVLGHMVLRALVLTVINLDDDAARPV